MQLTCMSEAGSRKSDPQWASTIFMSFSMVGKRRLFTRIKKSLTCHNRWLGQQTLSQNMTGTRLRAFANDLQASCAERS